MSKKPSKPAAKKKPAKAPAKPAKKAAKPAAKSAPKAAAKPVKAAAKPAPAKPAAKPAAKATSKAPAKPAKAPPEKPAPAQAEADKKSGRKGITIVSPKPARKPAPPKPSTLIPESVGRLMDPKNPIRKPLIPSGPKAAPTRPLGAHTPEAPEAPRPVAKTPFGKRELDRFREILLRKRAELVGDVTTMETEALRGQSGSLSNLPQHIAEQGSEAYDQSLSLDLAAADRKLIREIDEALNRIANGTYGVCELSGKPIKMERLEELPWARYSIEAARELERQSMRS